MWMRLHSILSQNRVISSCSLLNEWHYCSRHRILILWQNALWGTNNAGTLTADSALTPPCQEFLNSNRQLSSCRAWGVLCGDFSRKDVHFVSRNYCAKKGFSYSSVMQALSWPRGPLLPAVVGWGPCSAAGWSCCLKHTTRIIGYV